MIIVEMFLGSLLFTIFFVFTLFLYIFSLSLYFGFVPLQMDSDFQRLLVDGAFKKDPGFIHDQQKLQKILTYLEEVPPSAKVMDIALNLLKFFRFSIALTFHSLYRRISSSPPELTQTIKEWLLQVAAYVRSLVKQLGVEMFEEIAFFFQWGQAKKKYKMPIVQEERRFGQFIWTMGQQKAELAKGKWDEQSQDKVDTFLGATFKGANLFEERSIELMKSSALDIINALYANREEQRPIEVVKHKEPRPLQRREQPQKPKRNESIPLHSQPSRLVLEQEIGICCRTSFTRDQVIGQPQSLRIEYKYYSYPFNYKAGEVPDKCQKIKRTLCGFLNAQGGIIYFGIKEIPESKERIINGMILSERDKKGFGIKIAQLMHDVLPGIGKKWSIKYVPVKDKRGNYITGSYVAKLIVEQGSRDQVYSYRQYNYKGNGQSEKFAFKTENEVLEISDVQRVFRIFKDKVLNTNQRNHYPTHSHPCPEPQLGKPLYESLFGRQVYDDKVEYRNDDSFQYQERKIRGQKYEEKKQYTSNRKYQGKQYDRPAEGRKDYFDQQDFPSIMKEDSNNWHEQQESDRYRKSSRFMQKQTNQYLLEVIKQDVQILLKQQGIATKLINDVVSDVQSYSGWTYLVLENARQATKLLMFSGEVTGVYQRISYRSLSEDQLPLMESIILEYRKNWGVITKERNGKIIVFNNSMNACVFYIKMKEMGLNVEFTPVV